MTIQPCLILRGIHVRNIIIIHACTVAAVQASTIAQTRARSTMLIRGTRAQTTEPHLRQADNLRHTRARRT